MAVKTKKKKEQSTHEMLENPQAIAEQISRTEEYIEKHKTLVFGIGTVIVLIVGGFFGFKYYKGTLEGKAQSEMFQAVYYLEADSLEYALKGDGNNLGFTNIVDEYGITDAANLANYYAGVAYLKKGDFKLAILYLEDFKADDLLVQARAYSLIGDAHMELNDYEKAATFYQQAADYKSNKYFTPGYLLKAALAYEKLNDTVAAINAYNQIIDNYWEASEYQSARKYLAQLEGVK